MPTSRARLFAAVAVVAALCPAPGALAEPAGGTRAAPDLELERIATSGLWPRQIVLRPLTLPDGAFTAALEVAAADRFERVAAGPRLTYGLTSLVELTVAYRAPLRDFTPAGIASLGFGGNLVRDPRLDLTARAELGYSFEDRRFEPLVAGLAGKYLVTPRLAAVMPATQLTVALEGQDRPVFVRLPVGVAVQATGAMYVEALVDLATVGIRDQPRRRILVADQVPVTLLAVLAATARLDLSLGLSVDLRDAPDTLILGAALRYHHIHR